MSDEDILHASDEPTLLASGHRNHYRFLAWSVESAAILANLDGATELGVPLRPDDELLVLYRPDVDRDELQGFVDRLRKAGHDVVWEGE